MLIPQQNEKEEKKIKEQTIADINIEIAYHELQIAKLKAKKNKIQNSNIYNIYYKK